MGKLGDSVSWLYKLCITSEQVLYLNPDFNFLVSFGKHDFVSHFYISPLNLWQKMAEPSTNCNIRFFFVFVILEDPKITY